MSRDRDGELEQLYEQTRARLRVKASRVVGWDDAEDVVQDAFVRALSFPDSFRGDASLTTWMTRIVFNTAIDETRRRKRRPTTVPLDRPGVEYGVPAQHPSRFELKASLATRSRSDRQILVLAGVLGLSHRETAQRLGLTIPATKSRLWTARGRLRNALAHSGQPG